MKNKNKMNKIIKIRIYFLFSVLLIAACSKEENFKTFDPPVWNIDETAGYYENMTAVVKLQNNLIKNISVGDKLAAFAGDECRGIGVLVDSLYFVSIKGTPDDKSNISFKYYCTKNKYLYQTGNLLTFDANVIFGTVDEPKILEMVQVNE
jgi:hypothetical protein